MHGDGDPWRESREAHERTKPRAGELRSRLLYLLSVASGTDPEIIQAIAPIFVVSPSGTRTRRAELVQLGLIEAKGSKDHHTIWGITQNGLRLVVETGHEERIGILDEKWRRHCAERQPGVHAMDLLGRIVGHHVLNEWPQRDALIAESAHLFGYTVMLPTEPLPTDPEKDAAFTEMTLDLFNQPVRD